MANPIRREYLLKILIYLTIVFLSSAQAQEDVITIKVKVGETIRQISTDYLGDPDLWQAILIANDLKTAADLKPGMTIKIPVTAITNAHKQLDKSQERTREAVKMGAKILAGDLVSEAIKLRNIALEHRKQNEWSECERLAKLAYSKADEAIKFCESQSNVPIKAELNNKVGMVQSRTLKENTWFHAPLHTKFEEGDRVRTLTKSLAEILFIDDSRLRLEENSQAMIQMMRTNRLNNKSKAKVSLLEGDFFALLAGTKSTQNFDVDIKDIKTDIASSQFRISRDDKQSKFANYQGEIELTASGATVKLEKNQGSVVKKNQKPTTPKDLLPGPKPLRPENAVRVAPGLESMAWETVSGAAAYKLEVARDREFSRMVTTQTLLKTEWQITDNFDQGVYYWQVAAIDQFGLIGPTSPLRSFYVVADKSPPYLVVHEPADNSIVAVSPVKVVGETERSATVMVNRQAATVAQTGAFTLDVELSQGENKLHVIAQNELGRTTEKTVNVTYYSKDALVIRYDQDLKRNDDGVFIVNHPFLTLNAVTQPKADVSIISGTGPYKARMYADDAGNFQFNIPLNSPDETFHIDVKSASGDTWADSVVVSVDTTPPELKFDKSIPKITGEKQVTLMGRVLGGSSLTINGSAIKLVKESFVHRIPVTPPGITLTFVAEDMAGNETRISKSISVDQEPPQLRKVFFNPAVLNNGGNLSITVSASDPSGLKRAVPYKVQVGKQEFPGFLILGGDRTYKGSLNIPVGVKGTPTLSSVTLEDLLGNKAETK